jgi:hypothetical protein
MLHLPPDAVAQLIGQPRLFQRLLDQPMLVVRITPQLLRLLHLGKNIESHYFLLPGDTQR